MIQKPTKIDAVTASLRVLSARALTVVVSQVASEFQTASGCHVELVFGTVGALQAKLEAGELADVVIVSALAIERLEKTGRVREGGRRAIGRAGIGLAVRDGAKRPDIATPDAFKATLLNVHSIAVSDPSVGGSAGTYLANLFERMGVSEDLKRKVLPQRNGADVARCVAEGRADIGLTQLSEMVGVAGIDIVGELPAPLAHDTAYVAAIGSGCGKTGLANDFIWALVSPAARRLLVAAGLKPPSHD
jgi:molybdate transport system substrate-binding protein